MPPRAPFRIVRLEACFVIRDAAGVSLAYVYFENDATRAGITRMMPEAEARELARRIARALSAGVERGRLISGRATPGLAKTPGLLVTILVTILVTSVDQ